MKTAWFAVLAACGGAPAEKPVDNVVKAPAYSCETAADAEVRTLTLANAEKARVHDALVAACRDDHWPDAYVRCTSAGTAPCEDARTPEQQKHVHIAVAMATMPQSCRDYVHAIEKLAACDKFPAESRDAMRQGADAMMEGFNWTDMTAEQRKTAEDAAANACQQANDAIAQGAKAMGCAP